MALKYKGGLFLFLNFFESYLALEKANTEFGERERIIWIIPFKEKLFGSKLLDYFMRKLGF